MEQVVEEALEHASKADVKGLSRLVYKLLTISLEASRKDGMPYMAVVREAEAIQVGDANVGASILHPHRCAHLAAQLFVHCARMPSFCQLMGQGATENKLLVEIGRFYLDRYTHVETASNPLAHRLDGTFGLISKRKEVLDESFDCLSVVPELLVELRFRHRMCRLVYIIRTFPRC